LEEGSPNWKKLGRKENPFEVKEWKEKNSMEGIGKEGSLKGKPSTWPKSQNFLS